jgi:uncharacterized membrane protein YfcA
MHTGETMTDYLIVLALGLAAGILGGFFGVGGGVLIVPALVLLIGTEQHTAVGTSLAALLPPVGFLGAYEYYKYGHVNIMYAALLGGGLLFGAWFGSIYAVKISGPTLRRAFAIFLFFTSIQMFWKR